MKFEPMKSTSVAQDRKGFERNLNILTDLLRKRKIHFPSQVEIDSLTKLRYLPNRRINFLTVNETARLMANTVADMTPMQEYQERDEEEQG